MNNDIQRRSFLAGAATTTVAGLFSTQAHANTSGKATQPSAAPYKAPSTDGEIPLSVLVDLEHHAEKALTPGAFAFIARGAEKEVTLHDNMAAFDRHVLRPHYLGGKAVADPSIELLGHKLSMPIITAPMGAQGLAHVSAEPGTAKGTSDAGSLLTVSTASNTSIEDIAKASSGPKWFQIYLLNENRPGSKDLLQRAKAAGYTAIVFTIDSFMPGISDAVAREKFSFPKNLAMPNSGGSVFQKSLSWDDLKFIQDSVDLPVILKGVLTPETAQKALDSGVSAIQVSNHGGRQLDGSQAALDALPPVVDVVKGKVPVLVDGGIRRGSDVFKALALGASAVAVGRPVLYGLALGGAAGVTSVLNKLNSELVHTMTVAGAANVKEISKDFLLT